MAGDVSRTTMLARLARGRIFTIGHDETGFYIQEACDEYFCVSLTKADLIQLAAEIVELANAH